LKRTYGLKIEYSRTQIGILVQDSARFLLAYCVTTSNEITVDVHERYYRRIRASPVESVWKTKLLIGLHVMLQILVSMCKWKI